MLDEITSLHRGLIYGDGDGRFLAELVKRAPQVEVTAVDASAEMLRQTARKLPAGSRVRLVKADALTCDPGKFPEAPFDLVVSHFFLDCFTEAETALLLTRVQEAVHQGTIWIVSDFAIPERTPAKQIANLIVHGLYRAFGLLTGLRIRCLPDHSRVMQKAGWLLEDRQQLLFGLLVSERWRRPPSEREIAN